jgi:hypothetical protein
MVHISEMSDVTIGRERKEAITALARDARVL